MKPVLIVEGKAVEVCAVFYRGEHANSVSVLNESGVTTLYVDIKENTQYYTEKPLQIDFSKALVFPWQYDEAIETLNAHLEESEQYLQEMKNKIAEEVICNLGLPFPEQSQTIKNLAEECVEHKTYIDGIAASIELVKGLVFTQCE